MSGQGQVRPANVPPSTMSSGLRGQYGDWHSPLRKRAPCLKHVCVCDLWALSAQFQDPAHAMRRVWGIDTN